jgi:hypothetical protein
MTALGFIEVFDQRDGDTRGDLANARQQLAVAGTTRSRLKVAGVGREVAPCGLMKFTKITEMPLEKIYQITLNFSI